MINFDYDFTPIELTKVDGSSIYVVDDFYKDPQSIVDFIQRTPKNIHKQNEHPSYNMVHFRDERHCLYFEQLNKLKDDIAFFTNSIFKDFNTGCNFFTNCQMWYDNSFNNYEENYWWPHTDFGITALVYLNQDDWSGTNIYNFSNDFNAQEKTKEHLEPWRQKCLWDKVYTIPSKFNRLVLFNGGKLFHGADVNSKKYSDEYRINQVMFFEKQYDTVERVYGTN